MFLRLFHAEPSYLGPAAFWPKTHPAPNSNRDPPTMSVFFMFCLPLIPVSSLLFGRTIECLLQRYTAPARYDRKNRSIEIHLSSNLKVSFSPRDAQGLEEATPLQL